jgi:hypothetical protein
MDRLLFRLSFGLTLGLRLLAQGFRQFDGFNNDFALRFAYVHGYASVGIPSLAQTSSKLPSHHLPGSLPPSLRMMITH